MLSEFSQELIRENQSIDSETIQWLDDHVGGDTFRRLLEKSNFLPPLSFNLTDSGKWALSLPAGHSFLVQTAFYNSDSTVTRKNFTSSIVGLYLQSYKYLTFVIPEYRDRSSFASRVDLDVPRTVIMSVVGRILFSSDLSRSSPWLEVSNHYHFLKASIQAVPFRSAVRRETIYFLQLARLLPWNYLSILEDYEMRGLLSRKTDGGVFSIKIDYLSGSVFSNSDPILKKDWISPLENDVIKIFQEGSRSLTKVDISQALNINEKMAEHCLSSLFKKRVLSRRRIPGRKGFVYFR